jgi:hypothetical protein
VINGKCRVGVGNGGGNNRGNNKNPGGNTDVDGGGMDGAKVSDNAICCLFKTG